MAASAKLRKRQAPVEWWNAQHALTSPILQPFWKPAEEDRTKRQLFADGSSPTDTMTQHVSGRKHAAAQPAGKQKPATAAPSRARSAPTRLPKRTAHHNHNSSQDDTVTNATGASQSVGASARVMPPPKRRPPARTHAAPANSVTYSAAQHGSQPNNMAASSQPASTMHNTPQSPSQTQQTHRVVKQANEPSQMAHKRHKKSAPPCKNPSSSAAAQAVDKANPQPQASCVTERAVPTSAQGTAQQPAASHPPPRPRRSAAVHAVARIKGQESPLQYDPNRVLKMFASRQMRELFDNMQQGQSVQLGGTDQVGEATRGGSDQVVEQQPAPCKPQAAPTSREQGSKKESAQRAKQTAHKRGKRRRRDAEQQKEDDGEDQHQTPCQPAADVQGTDPLQETGQVLRENAGHAENEPSRKATGSRKRAKVTTGMHGTNILDSEESKGRYSLRGARISRRDSRPSLDTGTAEAAVAAKDVGIGNKHNAHQQTAMPAEVAAADHTNPPLVDAGDIPASRQHNKPQHIDHKEGPSIVPTAASQPGTQDRISTRRQKAVRGRKTAAKPPSAVDPPAGKDAGQNKADVEGVADVPGGPNKAGSRQQGGAPNTQQADVAGTTAAAGSGDASDCMNKSAQGKDAAGSGDASDCMNMSAQGKDAAGRAGRGASATEHRAPAAPEACTGKAADKPCGVRLTQDRPGPSRRACPHGGAEEISAHKSHVFTHGSDFSPELGERDGGGEGLQQGDSGAGGFEGHIERDDDLQGGSPEVLGHLRGEAGLDAGVQAAWERAGMFADCLNASTPSTDQHRQGQGRNDQPPPSRIPAALFRRTLLSSSFTQTHVQDDPYQLPPDSGAAQTPPSAPASAVRPQALSGSHGRTPSTGNRRSDAADIRSGPIRNQAGLSERQRGNVGAQAGEAQAPQGSPAVVNRVRCDRHDNSTGAAPLGSPVNVSRGHQRYDDDEGATAQHPVRGMGDAMAQAADAHRTNFAQPDTSAHPAQHTSPITGSSTPSLDEGRASTRYPHMFVPGVPQLHSPLADDVPDVHHVVGEDPAEMQTQGSHPAAFPSLRVWPGPGLMQPIEEDAQAMPPPRNRPPPNSRTSPSQAPQQPFHGRPPAASAMPPTCSRPAQAPPAASRIPEARREGTWRQTSTDAPPSAIPRSRAGASLSQQPGIHQQAPQSRGDEAAVPGYPGAAASDMRSGGAVRQTQEERSVAAQVAGLRGFMGAGQRVRGSAGARGQQAAQGGGDRERERESLDQEGDDADAWTEEQRHAFAQAMTRFNPLYGWERIAAAVPGKDASACMQFYWSGYTPSKVQNQQASRRQPDVSQRKTGRLTQAALRRQFHQEHMEAQQIRAARLSAPEKQRAAEVRERANKYVTRQLRKAGGWSKFQKRFQQMSTQPEVFKPAPVPMFNASQQELLQQYSQLQHTDEDDDYDDEDEEELYFDAQQEYGFCRRDADDGGLGAGMQGRTSGSSAQFMPSSSVAC